MDIIVKRSSPYVNTVLISLSEASICLGVFSSDELEALAEKFHEAANRMMSEETA